MKTAAASRVMAKGTSGKMETEIETVGKNRRSCIPPWQLPGKEEKTNRPT